MVVLSQKGGGLNKGADYTGWHGACLPAAGYFQAASRGQAKALPFDRQGGKTAL
jgi:hypothetical protein